jgi:hypothetical protein
MAITTYRIWRDYSRRQQHHRLMIASTIVVTTEHHLVAESFCARLHDHLAHGRENRQTVSGSAIASST